MAWTVLPGRQDLCAGTVREREDESRHIPGKIGMNLRLVKIKRLGLFDGWRVSPEKRISRDIVAIRRHLFT
jgi:hypothetical protein